MQSVFWYTVVLFLFYRMMEISLVNSYICYYDVKGNISFIDIKRGTTLDLLTCGKQMPSERGILKSDKNVLPQQAAKKR